MKSSFQLLSAIVRLAELSTFVVGFLLVSHLSMLAQNQGDNAVCTAASGCILTAPSPAFLDANMFLGGTQGQDFCDTLYYIFTHGYPSSGSVIDARAISGSALTCSRGTPWFESSTGYVNVPSTVLLPATNSTNPIKISSTWILPNGTKLIGEETTDPALNTGGTPLQTTIEATSSMTSGSAMIQFGDSTHCPSSVCTGISVEQLTLYGNGHSLIGIQNVNSQDQSYVDHVTMYHVLGTGLFVGANPSGGSAMNSGPYANIQYDTGNSGVSGSGCAQIEGLSSTHGLRGLTCISSPESQSAVLVDSSNNTIEDVRINGFYNGIVIGSLGAASSNVLRNIYGESGTGGLPVAVVEISNNNPVSDISIMGVNNPSASQFQYTIEDEVTSTFLNNPYVGMYVLGEKTNGRYSRFMTSTSSSNNNAVTWAFGTSKPTGSCPTGSLYSCTSPSGAPDTPPFPCQVGSTSYAFFGCVSGAWVPIR
jgi:hypothetical protein